MHPTINELLKVAHRAESEAALSAGSTGDIPNLRSYLSIPIQSERDIDVYNLGVVAGVHALLNSLSEHGYQLIDVNKAPVIPEQNRDRRLSFGESFKRWLGPRRIRLIVSNPPQGKKPPN